jgi:hypothetical protein
MTSVIVGVGENRVALTAAYGQKTVDTFDTSGTTVNNDSFVKVLLRKSINLVHCIIYYHA